VRAAGRLELALTLIVIGAAVAVALDRIDELTSAAHRVVALFNASQQRAAATLATVHCPNSTAASGAASSPCPSPTPRTIP
jgi:hypothetical protein